MLLDLLLVYDLDSSHFLGRLVNGFHYFPKRPYNRYHLLLSIVPTSTYCVQHLVIVMHVHVLFEDLQIYLHRFIWLYLVLLVTHASSH